MRRAGAARLLMLLIGLALIAACTGTAGNGQSDDQLTPYRDRGRCAAMLSEVRAALQGITRGVDRGTSAKQINAANVDVQLYAYLVPPGMRPPILTLHDSLTSLRQALDARDKVQIWKLQARAANDSAAVNEHCPRPPGTEPKLPRGAEKIEHVVFIMQENRSFDHYFGTYPGADGIKMRNGVPTVCVPNPATGGCTRPFHDPNDANKGGPHTLDSAKGDVNGGAMDGYIREWHKTRKYCLDPAHALGQTCLAESAEPDVMGYHDRRELPNYWAYADNFVLQDAMFAPNLGWSQPAHLAMVSAWSAACSIPMIPATCRPSITFNDVDNAWPDAPSYGWTDITYLLHKYGVSWRYYVAPGSVNECEGTTDEMIHCTPGVDNFEPIGTPEPWNPLPDFVTVRENNQVRNIQFHPKFFEAARKGELAAVTWVLPGWYDSEHPPELVSRGQAWVTRVVNAVMRSPDWESTAIFVSWDDWGGYYDHVPPPKVDSVGYGLRVPGLVISPYAKSGYIDHNVYSFDSYLRFIQDLFLQGQRLDPYTNGRWDPRPSVREDEEVLGDLMSAFDFTQKPLKPLVLPPRP